MPNDKSNALTFLIIFVCFYITSLSTYTYLNSISITNKKNYNKSIDEDSNRLRRGAWGEKNADHWEQTITLNKCCGENQIINNRNECESQEVSLISPANDVIQKLQFFVVDKNLKSANINTSRIKFEYNYLTPSFIQDAIVVNWLLNDNSVKTNYLFLQKDGTLLELDDSRTKILKKFSKNSYCLDQNNYFQSGLIAYVNPCIEHVCLRKCCSEGWLYDALQTDCVQGNGSFDYKPEFYFTKIKSTRSIPYYFFTGTPDCKISDSLMKIHTNLIEPNYIQEDGFLLVESILGEGYYYYDNQSYCVDMFLNGTQNPIRNGFYCSKEASFMQTKEVDIGNYNPLRNYAKEQHKENKTYNTKIKKKILDLQAAAYPKLPAGKPKKILNRAVCQRAISTGPVFLVFLCTCYALVLINN